MPRWRTPKTALMPLAGWSIVLALSGTYGQLLDYATFGDWLAGAVGVAMLFWYRRHDAGTTSFRATVYPWLPLSFIGMVAWVVVTTMRDNSRTAGIGVLIMLAGVPVYFLWRRLSRRARR